MDGSVGGFGEDVTSEGGDGCGGDEGGGLGEGLFDFEVGFTATKRKKRGTRSSALRDAFHFSSKTDKRKQRKNWNWTHPSKLLVST